MAWNTLAEIASEKAGIIKPGIPVVVPPQRPDAEQVIRTRAAECKAPLQFVTEHYDRSPIGLRGDHQKQNAALAMPRFVWPRSNVDDKANARGLVSIDWPARFPQNG